MFSPHIHPHRWLFVNGSIIVWSGILLALILGSDYDDNTTKIELNYLVYNFLTCIVWVAEVFFNLLDYNKHFDDKQAEGETSLLQPRSTETRPKTMKESVTIWVEVALAVYFFADSTTVAAHLSQEQIHREAKGMIIDVCINFAAYSFIVYRQIVDWKAQRTK